MDNRQPEWTGKEELTELKYRGHIVPGYKIARTGLIISYKVSKKGRPLTWSRRSPKADYPAVKLQIPIETIGIAYSSKSYDLNHAKVGMIARRVDVHLAVADTWLWIDSCPLDLELYWSSFSIELKEIMRSYFQVDHIDNDRWNPHVSNLRFVSPRHNNPHIKAAMQAEEAIKNSS